ncbi:Hypothetical protein ADU73_0951 [Pediococcus damnosus]|uniref:McrB family protein n=1 Tax=Pediococcus damnosus TaxID=51663 RepID=UPI00078D2F05|nr:AAA family ATPase [Pediococcus damnosus]AMV69357.1 Hypothetical protein ADU73_0951 [Pediococcus damnosus]
MPAKKTILVEKMEHLLQLVGGKNRTGENLFITRGAVQKDLQPSEKGTYGFISFIRSDQQPSGPYSGLSIKVNPGKDHYRISLDIGNEGFGDDYQLATLPGTRRKYLELQHNIRIYAKDKKVDIKCFSALDFSNDSKKRELSDLEAEYYEDNIDSHPVDLFVAFTKRPTFNEDGIADENEDFWKVFKVMIAVYAELRQWPNIGEAKRAQLYKQELNLSKSAKDVDEVATVKHLLKTRRYVVVQGAPGTGKTYLTATLRKEYVDQNVIFTQFHAETTYSDFVGGYQPVTENGNLTYRYHEGPFLRAIKKAKDSKDPVLLIIDEINRANLSNVLGEAFYLFETHFDERRAEIEIGDPQAPVKLQQLPKNMRVIATMNTADRSLAVIDFALRRRFAWFTMNPREIKKEELSVNEKFHKEIFIRLHNIFQMYANSNELMLEPGQAYFITAKDNAEQEMKERLMYELLPLIREYLENGLMMQASDAFNQFFITEIDQTLFI